MKKLALVIAALAATSASALAGDFAATLHYPEGPKPARQADSVDRVSTRSIVRKPAVTSADKKTSADTKPAAATKR